MLIIVPTLAGTWPAVRSIVNRFDTAAASLSGEIDNDLQEFNQQLSDVQHKLARTENNIILTPVIEQMSATVNNLQEEVQNLRAQKNYAVSLPTPKLPHAWASAFFAALFAVLGHGVYQAFAPETIRKATMNQFVRDARDDYILHPDEAKIKELYNNIGTISKSEFNRFVGDLAIIADIVSVITNNDKSRVIEILKGISLRDKIKIFRSLVISPTVEKWLPIEFSLDREFLLTEIEKLIEKDVGGRSAFIEQVNAPLLEAGMRIWYSRIAHGNLPAMPISLLCYIASIVIIAAIAYHQSTVILDSANMSLFDLFKFQ